MEKSQRFLKKSMEHENGDKLIIEPFSVKGKESEYFYGLENLKNKIDENYSKFCKEIKLRDMSAYAIFPLNHKQLFSFFETQRDMFWVVQEIDFSSDRNSWDTLSSDEKGFVIFILFFFSQADGIVMENLSSNFQDEIDLKEVKAFYAIQNAIEAIHNECYSTMIESVIRDEELKTKALNAITFCPEIRKMAAWIFFWMDRMHDIRIRIFAFACFEGIFFSAAFCAIRWLGENNKMPGFVQANELIARDEKIHLKFAIKLLSFLGFGGEWKEVAKNIVLTSFDILSEFIRKSLKVELIGLESEGMLEYAKCCYNKVTVKLGFGEFFPGAKNPYEWMKKIGMPNKTNFFERKVTEYAKVSNTSYKFERLKEY